MSSVGGIADNITANVDRPTLGNAVDVICFQYLCNIVSDLTGRSPIIAASRARGYDAMNTAGFLGSTRDSTIMCEKLNSVLGPEGTHLCLIHTITNKPNGGYTVELSECACSYGQTSIEPACSYTLGVIIGAVQAITNTRMQGRETECQSCGADTCIYEIDPV
ncbi:MAG: 4-vinyl reductase [Chloroflexota bacterium]